MAHTARDRARMLLLTLLPFLTLCPTAAALSANAWLTHGRAQGELKLGLLPFLLEHAMLPGETRDVFLFDDSLKACVSAAADADMCVGGLLMNMDGSHFELLTLLRIDAIRPDSDCTWVRLACTGRCLINNLRKKKRQGYRVAIVSPCHDSDNSGTLPVPDALRAIHGQVASQRRQLKQRLLGESRFDAGTWETVGRDVPSNLGRGAMGGHALFVGPDKGRAPFGVYESYESFEENGVLCEHVYVGQHWERPHALGCCYFNARDLGELDDEENGAELSELLATRHKVLVGPKDESCDGSVGRRAGLVDVVGEVWDVASEEEAHLQLLSFAAAATLGPLDRAQALMLTDTTRRLEFAQGQLCEQQSLLTDLLVAG